MMTSMDTEFTEEEIVENPTLKAAYNLAPLHQNQPLRWDYEVDLIGEKVFDKVLHLCEVCELPILVYGRLLPCKHIFCFLCARKCETHCKRAGCGTKVQKVEELALGTVYVCTHGAPKHSMDGCRRTYLSQRDLQSHIAHRHLAKPSSNESKASSNSQQPQLPLTQQQAAALQQQHAPSQSGTTIPSSQPSNLLPSMHNQQTQQHQQVLPSPSYIHQQQPQQQQQPPPPPSQHHHHHHHQASPRDIGQQQRVAPIISGLGSNSVSPALSQASPDIKSNPMMPHSMAYNPPLQTSDQQSIYRPIDTTPLPHQFQSQQQQQSQLHTPHQSLPLQQQQQHHSQQQHLPIPLSQQHQHQISPQMLRRPGSPGMSTMSKPMPRFSQPMQNPMSSPMPTVQGSHGNPFQMSTSGSNAEMQMSTQMHHQQPRQNISMHHQQHQQQQMRPRPLHKSYPEMQSDMDSYDRLSKMDSFGNPRQIPNLEDSDNMQGGGLQSMDDFGSMQQQRKLFNPHQDLDDRERVFNPHQPNRMEMPNNLPPNPQVGQNSRNKNVNLITVPIQDEGQYRPLPYINQSQPPGGGSGVGGAPFSSSMPVSSNRSPNYSTMNSQTPPIIGVGGGGGIRPPHRMPFNRPINSLPQQESPQGSLNPNMMVNNPRGIGIAGGGARLTLGANMPPNVQGAIAGAVQALTRSVVPQHNPRFNAPRNPGHWSVGGGGGSDVVGSIGADVGGNLRPIQPRMTQNLPGRGGPKAEGQFKQQGYYR